MNLHPFDHIFGIVPPISRNFTIGESAAVQPVGRDTYSHVSIESLMFVSF